MRTLQFVDHGFAAGVTFCHAFLASPEFTETMLREISGLPRSFQKGNMALEIAQKVEDGDLDAVQVMLSYAKRERMWVSFQLGSAAKEFEAEDPSILLTQFGEETWYGPLHDEDGSRWYLRTHRIPRSILDEGGGGITKADVRWVIGAKLREQYLAFFWNGFTNAISQQTMVNTQFPFWKYIGPAFEELTTVLGGQWKFPRLHELVLDQMWSMYAEVDGFEWEHLRIRAESAGVALSARSAGVAEIDVKGLAVFTAALAASAAGAVNISDSSEKDAIEKALLKTLIHQWGTRSYEFRLDHPLNADLPERLFRAHCYFGNKPDGNDQDSLQHLRCYKEYGWSSSALAFLLEHMDL